MAAEAQAGPDDLHLSSVVCGALCSGMRPSGLGDTSLEEGLLCCDDRKQDGDALGSTPDAKQQTRACAARRPPACMGAVPRWDVLGLGCFEVRGGEPFFLDRI